MHEYFRASDLVIPPKRATEKSSCYDVHAFLEEGKSLNFKMSSNIDFTRIVTGGRTVLSPGERLLVPTGLFFNIAPGYEMKLYSRSGTPWKHNITVHNSVGVIDEDYVKELFVMLHNNSTQSQFLISNGDRIAQFQFVEKSLDQDLQETKDKPGQKTDRDGGFGSTGVK